MIKIELKKNICSVFFMISIFLLYAVFLFNDSGQVLPGDKSTTVIGAIWSKFHGNWQTCSSSSFLTRMYYMWGNTYLPMLMPVICGLPGAIIYMEEIKTGNKRMMLTRCSLRDYYVSKIVANFVCAVLIALSAIALYYITLLCFYDNIPFSDKEFSFVYYIFSEEEDIMKEIDVSVFLIVSKLLKNVLYFCIYSIMCSSFCYLMAVWCKDPYVAFGGSIFLCYLLIRAQQAFMGKYNREGSMLARTAATIVNPTFLESAGRYGFYENREGLAVLAAFLITFMNYFIMVHLSRRQFDLSER